jgi:glyoxylase-like metal-dependent hydrolase (beta-lactamase superfamily II)
MAEYLPLGDRVGLIPLRTNIGVVRSEGSCVVIDTGIDEEAGKRILKTVTALGLRIAAVVNTHSHSDHYGGNDFLVKRTGCRVYAPDGEAWVIERPWLEAAYFSRGALPLQYLRNKFIEAAPSKVDVRLSEGPFSAEGVSLEAVPLPGHSFAMTGIRSGEVLFCGDSLFGEETIAKHGVLYLHDPDKARESLRKLETFDCDWFVPSHGPPCRRENLSALVAANVGAIDSFDEAVIRALDAPMSASALASKALTVAGLHLDDLTKVTLMQSTALAHISSLSKKGRIVISAGAPGTDAENDVICSPS